MNLENCRVLSTVEFGSTYQGTSDKYSDKDLMTLVVQPLQDVVFRNHEKAAVHKDEVRYYSAERFIRLILKGGYDNVLLLCAQLEQARETKFNIEVLGEFYNPQVFEAYIRANLKTLVFSVVGQINGLTRNKKALTGKELVKLHTFIDHLTFYADIVMGKEADIDYRTFSKVKSIDESIIQNKRRETTGLTETDLQLVMKSVDYGVDVIRAQLKTDEKLYDKYRKEMEHIEDRLKIASTHFMVEEGGF